MVPLLVCRPLVGFVQAVSGLFSARHSASGIEALRLGAVTTMGKPSGGVSFDLKEKRASGDRPHAAERARSCDHRRTDHPACRARKTGSHGGSLRCPYWPRMRRQFQNRSRNSRVVTNRNQPVAMDGGRWNFRQFSRLKTQSGKVENPGKRPKAQSGPLNNGTGGSAGKYRISKFRSWMCNPGTSRLSGRDSKRLGPKAMAGL